MKKTLIIFISIILTLSSKVNAIELYAFSSWLDKNGLQKVSKINSYELKSEIPEIAKPNYDTLLYFYWRYTNRNWTNNPVYTNIKASESPYKFKFNLREDDYINKQMQKTALLSYFTF